MRAFSVRATRRLVARIGVSAFAVTSVLGAQAAKTTTPPPPPSPQDEIINAERYVMPPEAIARLVNAPREMNYTYGAPSSGNRKYIMRLLGDGPPSLAAMSQTYYRLGGWEVDWSGNRARSLTTRNSIGIELYDWATGKTTKVELPAGARVSAASWSPDGSTIAYLADFVDATHIYLADPATGKSRPLTKTGLLATYVTSYEWTNDGKSVVAVMLPDNRGPEPKDPMTALSPRVRVNEDNKLKTRTNPSLLENEHEKNLLEYYTTGQLAVIDLKTRAVTKVGAPGMIQSVSSGSDGKYFRVMYLDKPFSYYLPTGSFGRHEVIIDQTGKVLTQISKRLMSEGVDPDSALARVVSPNPAAANAQQTPAQIAAAAAAAARADTAKAGTLTWHPFDTGMFYIIPVAAPAGVAAPADTSGAAAQGRGGRGGQGGRGGNGRGGAGGTAAAPPARADRIMRWAPPFDDASSTLFYESENRITGPVRWSDNGRIMFLTEAGIGTRSDSTYQTAIYLDEGNKRYVLTAVRGNAGGAAGGRGGAAAGGRGGAGGAGAAGPGSLETRPGTHGGTVIMMSTDGQAVFLEGTRPDSGKPARPFIDRLDIKTGTKTRLYEAPSTGMTETIVSPLDNDYSKAIVNRESATQPAQSFILDLKTKEAKQLTTNRDLTPEITNTIKRSYRARRADGYTFNIKVTLPPNWKEGQRMPALFWFYPSEFADQAAYDRGQTAPNPATAQRFPTTGARTMSFITAAGYALVEPDAPIFGTNGMLPNDNYVNDLRNDLAAAIDVLDSAGVIIRSQLAIGGHSYGAFSAVNAMVHTPFFKAGIAGDGAYNRTLTPNGFQSEQRDLWQGRSTYLDMSPFLYADRLNGALLMYHSLDDQNVGTDPINSIKLYHALQGLGKTTALYMYPYEDHGPVAKETNLDQWARWVAWLDKYVKGPAPKVVIP